MTETTRIPIEYRYLGNDEASDVLGLAPQTLRVKTSNGTGPKVTRIGRSTRFKYSDLIDWVNEEHDKAQAILDERAAAVEHANGKAVSDARTDTAKAKRGNA